MPSSCSPETHVLGEFKNIPGRFKGTITNFSLIDNFQTLGVAPAHRYHVIPTMVSYWLTSLVRRGNQMSVKNIQCGPVN